jgi:hypothetical protein
MNQTNIKRYRYFSFTLLLFLFASTQLLAQENTTVTGKVIDAKHQTPLQGASISIEGSTNVVASDNRGYQPIKTI